MRYLWWVGLTGPVRYGLLADRSMCWGGPSRDRRAAAGEPQGEASEARRRGEAVRRGASLEAEQRGETGRDTEKPAVTTGAGARAADMGG